METDIKPVQNKIARKRLDAAGSAVNGVSGPFYAATAWITRNSDKGPLDAVAEPAWENKQRAALT